MDVAAEPGRRGEPRDWVFLGFVAFALVVGTVTLVQRTRLERAVRRTAVCIARADVACATRGLEVARAVDEDDPRVRIAGAQLRVLLGRAPEGGGPVFVDRFGPTGAPLDPRASGDLFLLNGDLAAARGARAQAREQYEAARSLVGDAELVEARLERLGARASDELLALKQLRADLEILFPAIVAGQGGSVGIGLRDLGARVTRLENRDVQRKLSLALSAVDAAARDSIESHRKAKEALRAPPAMPPEPVLKIPDGVKNRTFYEESYKRERALYDAQRESLQRVREDDWRGRQEAARDAEARVESGLAAARKLLDEAAAILEQPGQAR